MNSQGRRVLAYLWAVIFCFLPFFSQANDSPQTIPGEYIVKMKSNEKLKAAFLNLQSMGEDVRLITEASRTFLVKRSLAEKSSLAIQSLSNHPAVEYVEPNYIWKTVKTPNDPKFENLWGLKNVGQKAGSKVGKVGIDVNAEDAWNIHTGSEDVVVAVIDTGVDYKHQDLASNMWTNKAELEGEEGVDDDGNGHVDDIYGYDFANDDADPLDDHGHGSHCAGTIGAQGDDGKGIVGVAWDVKIMALKFLTARGSGSTEGAIKAIDYATQMGADIMSNSWGGGAKSKALKEAIERARDKDILFVAAAGNSSADNDKRPHYPSSYETENILAVAAIDNQGQLAPFSCYGRKSVDIAAPGVKIFSSTPGDSYDSWSGTSMATPHVSGVAALLKSHDSNLSAIEIKERLMKTARPLAALRGKMISGGFVNAYYALTDKVAPLDPEDPFNWQKTTDRAQTAHPYENNTEEEFTFHVPGAKEMAVHFLKFETERRYDYVLIRDANGKEVAKLSGNLGESFSPTVKGDTIHLVFKSDKSATRYGFDIGGIAYR